MSQPSALTHAEVTMLMRFALGEAERGLTEREIPIGSVAVALGAHGLRIICRGHEVSTPAGHAVATVLGAALPKVRPNDAGLVVVTTVEPCAACMTACRAASVREVIWGLSHRGRSGVHRLALEGNQAGGPTVVPGVIAAESRRLLQSFLARSGGAPHAIAYAEELLHGAA